MNTVKKLGLVLVSFMLCTSAQAKIDIVTDGDTTLSFGGFVKAQAMSNMPDEGDSSLETTANESRFNLATSKMIEGREVTGFFEIDFYGNYKGFDDPSPSPELRLRHAYVKIDKLTIGKTWNGQFQAVAPLGTEQIDFFGTSFGTIASFSNGRPDLVIHYANNGLTLTAQEPANDESDVPDLVSSYTGKVSNITYNVAATARDVQTNKSDSEFGLGISLAGKMPIGDNGSLHASVFTGEGMGAYSSACVAKPSGDAFYNCDVEDGDLVSQTGFNIGYMQKFTDKLRGNLRYGEINVDDEADSSMKQTSANLIYAYAPEIDFGIEWRDYSETLIPVLRPKGQQVEVMVKYKF